MKKGAPAKYVTLAGNMTVAGMSRNNLDAVRDGCELHLHEESGGVVMTLKDSCIFIPSGAIHNVELETPVREDKEPSETSNGAVATIARTSVAPAAMAAPLQADKDKVATGARNLADEVLKELKDDPAPNKAAARRRRTK